MKLHHFTAGIFLPSIFADGLRFGDVPTSESEGINAVNLTSDHGPSRQRWAAASVIDKTQYRLTIEIPDGDPRLRKWTDFAREHVQPAFYDALNRAGGGSSDSWYIYQGIIPWAWVHRVLDTKTHKVVMNEELTLTYSEEMIRISREVIAQAQDELKTWKKASPNSEGA